MTKEEWVPSDGMTLERDALDSIRDSSNVLVYAGPGAGKTEILAQKALYLLQTDSIKAPQRILAISFKKDSAANLMERIEKRCGIDIKDRFDSMTYDAFSKAIVDQFRTALPESLRPARDYEISTDNEELNNILFTLKAPYGYRIKDLEDIGLEKIEKSPYFNLFQSFIKGTDKAKPHLTFKIICRMAEYIIKTNPLLKKAIRLTYKHVFLDEFQDTTELQYTLVKTCFKDSDSVLTAVGDNKQRIMLFAGAKKNVLNDFRFDFKATHYPLIMNHRSAPRLVELQKKLYSLLEEKNYNITTSIKWNNDDGYIGLLQCNADIQEADFIAEDIHKRIDKGLKPDSICILAKQKLTNYTGHLIAALKEKGITARIENEYQDLLKEPITNLLLCYIKLARDINVAKEWDNLISSMVHLKELDYQNNRIEYMKLEKDEDTFIEILKHNISNLDSKKGFISLISDIIQHIGLDTIHSMSNSYKQDKFFLERCNKFINLIWKEYTKEGDWHRAIENFLGLNSVPIMTIHKSKGLEFNTVYFIGLEDNAFWSYRKQREEDIRALFVALSRAKENIIFSFSQIRNDREWNNHTIISDIFNIIEQFEFTDNINLLEANDIFCLEEPNNYV